MGGEPKFPQLLDWRGCNGQRFLPAEHRDIPPPPRGCGSVQSRLGERGRRRARTTIPGGGPPYFLCPFTCTRRMPVSLTHASNAALFSGFTLSHHS